MPKRVIDFDAMWSSDKLAACAEWAQAEYAWLYGLADASGSFEVTNLRVIWGRVAAIRENFTMERLEQVFREFHENGLMFVWMHEGKRYAHWTGSDMPGRLPAPSWRMRLEKFAPPVPKEKLAEYMARFARGRAALGAAGFRGAAEESGARQENLKFEIADMKRERGAADGRRMNPGAGSDFAGGLGSKVRLEEPQGQDLGLDRNRNGNLDRGVKRNGESKEGLWEKGAIGNLIRGMGLDGGMGTELNSSENSNSKSTSFSNLDEESKSNANSKTPYKGKSNSEMGNPLSHGEVLDSQFNSKAADRSNPQLSTEKGSAFSSGDETQEQLDSRSRSGPPAPFLPNGYFYARGMTAKELATEKELRVGQGPVCGPKGVKPEVLDRARLRDAAARAGGGKGK